MRIGIRPINDFAFKKIFGTDTNKLSLISLEMAVEKKASLAAEKSAS